MNKPCSHGVILPRGLRCDRGYLIIRLKTEQGPFNKGCGPHTPSMEKVARLALDDIRVKQRLGSFSLPSKTTRIKFKDAAMFFFKRHYILWKDPESNEPRGKVAICGAHSMIKNLIEFFGEFYLDAISAKVVKDYRIKRVELDGVSNATFNKEKGVLSSLFTVYAQGIAQEEIDPVKLPAANPCKFVPDLREVARTRVATTQELTRLHQACVRLNDPVMWTAIVATLDTSLRRSDLVAAAGNAGRTIEIRQGKTKRMVRIPGSASLMALGGQFTNPRELYGRWLNVCVEAGINDLQWRDLRRTSAKLKESVGATRRQIKNALGHASEDMTEVYLPSDPEELREINVKTTKLLESL